jgi:peroxiredoxin Q/BCP
MPTTRSATNSKTSTVKTPGDGIKEEEKRKNKKQKLVSEEEHEENIFIPEMLMVQDARDEELKSLKSLFDEKPGIIFFYPKANTPGCTKQACGFQENLEKIQDAGYQIFGMSLDKPLAHQKWAQKYNLKYQLLTDSSGGDALKFFNVWKNPKGIKRSHVVVAKGGEVIEKQILVSPAESVSRAVEYVSGNKAKE